MTDLYTQSIDNPLTPNARRKQVSSAISALLGIFSIGLAIGVSYYFFILTAALLALSACLTVSFNSTIASYEYGCNKTRMVFSFETVISKTKRMIEILLEDVVEYSDFQDSTVVTDYIMCQSVDDDGVKALVFNVEGKKSRVLFKPDEYMNAFLKETLPKEVTIKNIG